MFGFGDKDKVDFFTMYLTDPPSFWQEFEIELKDLREARQEFVDWLHSEVKKRGIGNRERQRMKDLLAEIFERENRIHYPQRNE